MPVSRRVQDIWIRNRAIWSFYRSRIIGLHRCRVSPAFLRKLLNENREETVDNSCSFGTRSSREHPRKRVAAVAARRDMNRPERFIAPLRPCEWTCASQAVLVPSFSLPLSLSFSSQQPGFRFRFRIGSHTKSIKIIFTRFARSRDDDIGISDRFRSKNGKIADPGISRQGRSVGSIKRRAKKDSETLKSRFRRNRSKNKKILNVA